MSTEQDDESRLKEMINEILSETFNRLDAIYSENALAKQEGINGDIKETDVIFPRKRDDSKRVSEQEMRFIFTEVFHEKMQDNKYDEMYSYSVETPTKFLYRFSKCNCKNCENNGEKDYPHTCCGTKGNYKDFSGFVDQDKCNYGDTANFDLVIHSKKNGDKLKRLAWIEFKVSNAPVNDIAKDYLKLACEANQNAYFVQLLSTSDDNTTILNIQQKICDDKTNVNTIINKNYNPHQGTSQNGKLSINNITHIVHVLPKLQDVRGTTYKLKTDLSDFQEWKKSLDIDKLKLSEMEG